MVTHPGYNAPRRQLSLISLLLLLFLAVVLIGGGTFASLWAMGLINLPTVGNDANLSRKDKVPVLMAGQDIPAYTRVTRDHLINPETKEAANFWLAEEQIPPGVKRNLQEIAGRVLRHDKRAGFFFTEDDFLPPGTRPGLVAGIPVGKRSITLDATKIGGVAGLRTGDRFDIVASLTPSGKTNAPSFQRAVLGAPPRRAESKPVVKVVVDNGAVVLPVYLRGVPTTTHSMSGQQTTTKPVQEIVLAIAPHEVPLLTEMVAAGATLTAVARSGLPDDTQESRVSIEVEPEPPAQVIDVIKGNKRDQVILSPATNPAT
jgi:Flp pilus assembly protein CpaB